MKVTSLYICPWSLNDPLCQSQSLAYLRGLTEHDYKFALMTFENPKYAIAESQRLSVKKDLESQGIYWYPVAYHQGLSLFNKAYDNLTGFLVGLKVLYKHRPQIIHSRSSLTALLAVGLARASGSKFLYDADSLLSEEYADIGHWSRNSRGYKIMAKAEKLARKNASHIIVLTEVLKKDYQSKFGVKTPIDVIPCCVDTNKFRYTNELRERKRKKLNLSDEKLFVYVGKIGSRYLVKEIFAFFKEAQKTVSNCKLLIVSQDAPELFLKISQTQNVCEISFSIVKATPAEVIHYLAAADAGLAFIKNTNAERGSSPIKIAEYLAIGLPIIMNDEIGDISKIIKVENLGCVIEDFRDDAYIEATKHLNNLWNDENFLSRCNNAVEKYYSLQDVGVARYKKIYNQLLD